MVPIPATSEPALGSVSAKEENRSFSVKGWTNRFFCSSVPPMRMGRKERSLAISEVAMPTQPAESSSQMIT